MTGGCAHLAPMWQWAIVVRILRWSAKDRREGGCFGRAAATNGSAEARPLDLGAIPIAALQSMGQLLPGRSMQALVVPFVAFGLVNV